MFIGLFNRRIQLPNYHVIARSAKRDVAIPIDFRQHSANLMGIATLVLQSAANLIILMVAGGNHTTIL